MGVSWTAPGADGTVGTATAYDLRYRTDEPVTEANFSNSYRVLTSAPHASGTTEVYIVSGLGSCAVNYFGLKTQDELSTNWSVLRAAQGSTQCGGSGGGGGGGCQFCEELPPFARPAEGYVVTREEVGRLGDLRGAITLTHVGTTAVRLDSLALVDVAHGPESMAVVRSGEILLGEREQATEVRGSGGVVKQSVTGLGYAVAAGETLFVRFASSDSGSLASALLIEAESSGSEDEGVRVLTPYGDGRWRAVARVSPRLGNDSPVVDNVEADSVRLVFGSTYRLRAVSRMVPKAPASSIRTVAISSAIHSRLGVVAVPAGGASVVMEPGEMLRFDPVAGGESDTIPDRLLCFRVSGANSTPVRQRRASDSELPSGFTLAQNQPNPFAVGTTIGFALPVRSVVVLEVFDAHGRRVRRLARGEWMAGYHTLTWNGRDGAGQRLGAGIYLYRIEAGSFHCTHKLVMLP